MTTCFRYLAELKYTVCEKESKATFRTADELFTVKADCQSSSSKICFFGLYFVVI